MSVGKNQGVAPDRFDEAGQPIYDKSPSNTELREAIKQVRSNNQSLNSLLEPAAIDQILALLQAREQQLLKGLLGELPEEKEYIDFDDKATDDQDATYVGGFNEALSEVVSVIERYREGL